MGDDVSFAETWVASRRLFLLRLLVEVDGEANESNLYKGAVRGGFARDPREAIRTDLDHLVKHRLATEDWLGDVRVVKLTERGEECAYGRIAVEGVEKSRWNR